MLDVQVFMKDSGSAEINAEVVSEEYQEHGYLLTYKEPDFSEIYTIFFPWTSLGMIRYYGDYQKRVLNA